MVFIFLLQERGLTEHFHERPTNLLPFPVAMGKGLGDGAHFPTLFRGRRCKRRSRSLAVQQSFGAVQNQGQPDDRKANQPFGT